MLKWMRERLSRDEGFTLIELMVVVLIIAVLVAIAIPSFLGFRDRANDRSAQSDVRSAILAEKGHFTDNEVYTDADADIKAFVPTLETDDTALNATEVYIEQNSATQVCLHRQSKSGTVFSVLLNDDDPTLYNKNTVDPPAAIACDPLLASWNVDSTVGW